jgi:hypothetical protein
MLVNESLFVEAVIGVGASFDSGLGGLIAEIPNGSGNAFSGPPRAGDKILEPGIVLSSKADASAAAFSISASGGSGGRVFRLPWLEFGGLGKLFSICDMSIVDCSDSGLVFMTVASFPQIFLR